MQHQLQQQYRLWVLLLLPFCGFLLISHHTLTPFGVYTCLYVVHVLVRWQRVNVSKTIWMPFLLHLLTHVTCAVVPSKFPIELCLLQEFRIYLFIYLFCVCVFFVFYCVRYILPGTLDPISNGCTPIEHDVLLCYMLSFRSHCIDWRKVDSIKSVGMEWAIGRERERKSIPINWARVAYQMTFEHCMC